MLTCDHVGCAQSGCASSRPVLYQDYDLQSPDLRALEEKGAGTVAGCAKACIQAEGCVAFVLVIGATAGRPAATAATFQLIHKAIEIVRC